MNLQILYEDNHIVAIYKAAGVLVQPALPASPEPQRGESASRGDRPRDESLMVEVKQYLKEKYKKPGKVFLGLIHRLDRNVSGIVLFAKTSKGAARLSEQFRNNEIKKVYHAVVEGKIDPANGTLVHYLKKDDKRRIALVSDLPKSDYDRSELEYETVKSGSQYTLLKINLKTGRFHQIRAQLSAVGYPIVGDNKYLPVGLLRRSFSEVSRQVVHLKDGSIALCATEIEFKAATGEETKSIKIDYPAEWNNFLK